MSTSIRNATSSDLPRIIEIYNAAIPSRLATADTSPISLESRLEWFAEHNEHDRPLWVYCNPSKKILGWISLNSFYGRPAYQFTTEVSIYLASEAQGQGIGTLLLGNLLHYCLEIPVKTILGFVFAHNAPSMALFQKFGFEQWGYCPRIAELDAIERDLVILGKRIIPQIKHQKH